MAGWQLRQLDDVQLNLKTVRRQLADVSTGKFALVISFSFLKTFIASFKADFYSM